MGTSEFDPARDRHHPPPVMNAGLGSSMAIASLARSWRFARCLSPLALLIFWAISTTSADAGPIIKPGEISEFQIEVPAAWRAIAGGRRPARVTTVLVAISAPKSFDVSRALPMMVISATSDPGYNSSRAFMRLYSDAAMAAGWVLVAVDPLEKISQEEDTYLLRFMMVSAALIKLEEIWPPASSAPLAFGGYSGGSKHSGVLAAEFAARHRLAIGVFQGGINAEAVALAGGQLKVMTEAYRRIPVFLAGGKRDKIATPAAHRRVERELKKAGFEHVRLEFNDGPHGVDPAMLEKALKWFSELADN